MKAYYTIDTETAVQAAENLWGERLKIERKNSEFKQAKAKEYRAVIAFYENAPFIARLFMRRPEGELVFLDMYARYSREDYILFNHLKAALPLVDTVTLDLTNGWERQLAEECKRIADGD